MKHDSRGTVHGVTYALLGAICGFTYTNFHTLCGVFPLTASDANCEALMRKWVGRGGGGGGRNVHVLTYTNLTCVHAGLDLSVAFADMSWMGAGWTFHVACADMSWMGAGWTLFCCMCRHVMDGVRGLKCASSGKSRFGCLLAVGSIAKIARRTRDMLCRPSRRSLNPKLLLLQPGFILCVITRP